MRLVTCVIGTQRVGRGRAIYTRQATRGELLAGAPLIQSLFLQGHSLMDKGGRLVEASASAYCLHVQVVEYFGSRVRRMAA